MHKRLALSVVAAVLFSAWGDLHACGDKLLMVGRGLKFNTAYASLYPGSIVFYLPETSGIGTTSGVSKIPKFLAGAGHRVTIARTAAALEGALRLPVVDLVLVESSEISWLKSRITALPSSPGLVALVDTKQGTSFDGTLQGFAGTIASGDKPKRYLPMIEKLMKTSAERRARR